MIRKGATLWCSRAMQIRIWALASEAAPPTDWRKLRKKQVVDMNQIMYKPNIKPVFKDNRYLLYKNKQGLFTNWFLYSHLTASILYVGALMVNNPFYLTFPAALPIMFFLELALLRRFYLKQKRYRPIIEEVNLMEGGDILEVKYANSITRKLKRLPMSNFFWIPLMKPRDRTDLDPPIFHKQFPLSLEEAKDTKPWDYAWMKVYSNFDNHFMLPIRYDYANMEVLIEVFKGKVIDAT